MSGSKEKSHSLEDNEKARSRVHERDFKRLDNERHYVQWLKGIHMAHSSAKRTDDEIWVRMSTVR